MKKALLYIFVAVISFAFTSDKPAYVLYNQKGKVVKYQKMIKDLQEADIVFFGELHTDPIAHWMQFEITKALYEVKKQDLIIGSEMFESDNQLILDEYLDSAFAAKKFEADARLWPNYKTDYKPVMEFARENGLRYIATNIPRRYASVVHKKGFEGLAALSDEAKALFSPDMERLYDKDVACYADMMKMDDKGEISKKGEMGKDTLVKIDKIVKDTAVVKMGKMGEMGKKSEMGTMGEMGKKSGMSSHINENFPKAQAAKDATMAYFILKNWEEGKLFFHFDGAYHSDNFEGIVWWINKLKPGLNIKTISTVYQEDVEELEEENIDRANYIIAVPETMTQTNRK